jgi:pimeloyl-ACP methyl ester carboxylesterase
VSRRVPEALCRDPPCARGPVAQTLPQAIPSHGVNLNAVLYIPGGPGPHPTMLLLHGLPGNEQNLDLAQSARRLGWNVLTLHYRGSWGTPGTFSFIHCLEDAAAALGWLRAAGAGTMGRIDPDKIVVVGHSMGGFIAAHIMAADPRLLGACLISGVALGRAFGAPDKNRAVAAVDENVGESEGLHILAGTSPEALAEEAQNNATAWSLDGHAAALAGRPLLLITSDDGFRAGSDALAEALGHLKNPWLRMAHFLTDHNYSDHRITLQTEVLNWLELLMPERGARL